MVASPILLLIFNRPEETNKVFLEIRKQRPRKLFIAADGPRNNSLSDIQQCTEAQKIFTLIDWECELRTLVQDTNLGCGQAPATAITWFFQNVEYGIILEDDCLPNASFFEYCDLLLLKYLHYDKIMMISGTSYQSEQLNSVSYYFSKYPHMWGWASWRRAWKHYNYSFDSEDEITRKTVLKKTFRHRYEQLFWEKNLDMIIKGFNTWDYQWMYWIWKNEGVCITPWKNMISNIGFGVKATHTHDTCSFQSQMKTKKVSSLVHPAKIVINEKADNYERTNILIGSRASHYCNKLRLITKRVVKFILLGK
ncbi:hypothetical protein [Pedobacter aquatilis]|uniref:hypothetical protein n=1 Tax=Pedobacter aquatilis TaxID=351343 RepID=UPI00292F1E13|nr:hypothetical protein [Pedobacter aquatilis]